MCSHIRMKQTLRDFSNLLLVILCDYVLGEDKYLFLERSSHIALSKDTVFVEYRYQDNDTTATKNMSITLMNASTNQTIAEKELPSNEGVVGFECFYFTIAGHYQFTMTMQAENGSLIELRSRVLNVTWPVFHIDVNRTLHSAVSSLLIGVFTNEQLCDLATEDSLMVSVDFKHRNSLHESGSLSFEEALSKGMSKTIPLSSSQWVEFDCTSTNQDVFMIASLKSLQGRSVITSTGPIDLVKRFGYTLVVAPEQTCDSLADVRVVPPPCTLLRGKIVVYKETPRPSGERITSLAETVIYPGNDHMEINCTLFELGVNKYCFEFFMVSSKSHFFSRAKECIAVRRDIAAWGVWESWNPCSVTCGDGVRDRYRKCLTSSSFKPGCVGPHTEVSLCSLDDCSTVRPSREPSLQSDRHEKSSNTVTISGISLCLSIIVVTIVITMWRKLCRVEKCTTPARHSSGCSPTFRKNSDQENICQPNQVRESIFEGCESPLTPTTEAVSVPLNNRRSLHLAQEPTPGQDSLTHDSSQANTQKMIPPIFSYRLAQKQLKEMKKKGLTETTKVYHVCQNPLTDTLFDATILNPPLSTESSDENSMNTFRIKTPFQEPSVLSPMLQGEKPNARPPMNSYQAALVLSPSQTLTRLSHCKHQDLREGQFERGYRKNPNFRRTSSFHETKQTRPFRERSMTTLSPRQTAAFSSWSRTWDHGEEERFRPKSRVSENSSEMLKCAPSTRLTKENLNYFTKYNNARLMEKNLDWVGGQLYFGRPTQTERSETNKTRRGSPPTYRNSWRNTEESTFTLKESYQRSNPLTTGQNSIDKCQSFPQDPEYKWYDNTSFGLSEAEQRMIDLPGYFGSNEEDETSTMSIERLVI
ncbi:thrombospondin type-1 domain-containing protein 1 [Lissotriton helveticus]